MQLTTRLILGLLLSGLAPAQAESCGWSRDLDAATAVAKKEGRPILLLFTAGSYCPTSHCLEEEVFHQAEFIKRCGHCLRVEVPLASNTPADLLALARARLQVVPTLYFLDSVGWPFAIMQGYRKGSGACTLKRILEIVEKAPAPSKLPVDLRKRHANFLERSLPYGAALAAEGLEQKATPKLRRHLANDLIAPRLVRGQAIDDLLKLLSSDKKNRKAWITALEDAATWSLRLGRHAEAARFLKSLLAIEELKCNQRLDATISLGRLCLAAKAPCLAIRHFMDARTICKRLAEREQAKKIDRWLERKARGISRCTGECTCRLPSAPPRKKKSSPLR